MSEPTLEQIAELEYPPGAPMWIVPILARELLAHQEHFVDICGRLDALERSHPANADCERTFSELVDSLERAERERDEARETTAEAARGLLDLTEKLNAARADADRMQEALAKYGCHLRGCYVLRERTEEFGCTCGLQAALDSASTRGDA